MIFSIETSISTLSLACIIKGRAVHKSSLKVKNELSEIIVPAIKDFFIENSMTFQNISSLVVGCGPGSFTGIRTLISAAKGIQFSNINIKCIGINSLAGLAMSVRDEAKNKKFKYIISSIDTKRNDIFIQIFKLKKENQNSLSLSVINDIQIIDIINLNKYISANKLSKEDILFVGHQPYPLENNISNLLISDKLHQIPNACWVGKLGTIILNQKFDFKNSMLAYNSLKPIYVRSPEINH